MKRTLILFLSVVLIIAVMVVPAFAAGSVSLSPPNYELAEPLPKGEYTLTITWAETTIVSDPFLIGYELLSNTDGYGEFMSEVFLTFDNSDQECILKVEYDAFDGVVNDAWYSIAYGTYGTGYFEDLEAVLVFTPYVPDTSSAGIFDVFREIGSWTVLQWGSLVGIFWSSDSLTFLGVLAVAGLALAVILLLIFVIVRFLRFRG